MSERMETDQDIKFLRTDIQIKPEPIDDEYEEKLVVNRSNDYRASPSDDSIANMVCGRTFTDNPTRVTSVDYSPDGMIMIASNADDSLSVYNLHVGMKDKNVCVNSKKYGVGLIRYGGQPNTAIHSSTKIDHNLRYLNLHDNKYLRYFTGHTEKVTCLQVSPSDDKVISGSNDKTIRLWDLRTQHCQGIIDIPEGRPLANWDHTGDVFVLSSCADSIRFYDIRCLDKGPFVVYNYDKPHPKSEVINLEVSRDGNYVLQNMTSGHIRIIDYMTGHQHRMLTGHQNARYEDMEASFSACGKYVFCGSSDQQIFGWKAKTGCNFTRISTTHDSCVKVCRWNPRHCILATACTKICLWAPKMFDFCNNPHRPC